MSENICWSEGGLQNVGQGGQKKELPTLMGLGSSRNDLNSLISNWCTEGC